MYKDKIIKEFREKSDGWNKPVDELDISYGTWVDWNEVEQWLSTKLDEMYEVGYQDGESSGHADVVAYLDSDETDWRKAIDELKSISETKEEC